MFTPEQQKQIDTQSAGRGWAFLTQAQKDAITGPKPSVVNTNNALVDSSNFGTPITGASTTTVTKPNSISSSNSYNNQIASQTAVNNTVNGINNITNPQPVTLTADEQLIKKYKPFTSDADLKAMAPDMKNQLWGEATQAESAKTAADSQIKGAQQAYDATLAKNNADYLRQSQELEASRNLVMGQAKVAMGGSGPGASSDTAGINLTDTLNQKYQKQQIYLTSLAQAADMAAQSNQTAAYNAIQKTLNEANATFNKDVQSIMNTAIAQQTQQQQLQQNQQQFETTKAISQQQFTTQQQNIWADNFRSNLATMNYTQDDLNTMVSSGAIYKDPTYLAGIKSQADAYLEDPQGVSNGIIEAMKTGSMAQERIRLAAQTAATNAAYKDSMVAIALMKLANNKPVEDPEVTTTSPDAAFLWKAAKVLGTNMSDSGRRIWLQDLAKNVEGNDLESAKQRIFAQAYDKLPAASKAKADLANESNFKIDDSLNLLDEKATGTGPWKDLLNSAKPWLLIQKDQKYVGLKAAIETAQATIRKGFYGTAVTGNEESKANNFLITKNDDIATIRTKLDNLRDYNDFAKENLVRSSLGLPKGDSTLKKFMGAQGGNATVTMTGPKGTYQVSPDKVEIMKQNGYTIK